MKDTVKLAVIIALRMVLRIFYIFPVKKDYFLFSSFEGRQYSDNPKYLYQYIKSHFGNKYQYIWVLNDKNECPTEKIVRFLSLKHIYYLLTCKFIISNLGIEPFVPKRKDQIFINTWHGSGAYKSVDLSGRLKKNKYTVNLRDYRSKKTDYYISGCQLYSDVISISFNADKRKFLAVGTPRNDLLLNSSEKIYVLREKILAKLKLKNDFSYVLYAPTFRGQSFRRHDELKTELDFASVLEACRKRFGKEFKILYREHVGTKKLYPEFGVINISAYPDMQEILLITDVFITDYSSSMWDFALLKRPGFLFVPDLENYLKERDFYTPIDTWPFDYAKNNSELKKLILTYDESAGIKKIQEHQKKLGSFEKGCACSQIVNRLDL